ncbi:MAG TPA: YdeI/OmpD-associated family protein [Chitinophagaceae bacterium]|nr:YdeI/OmpD-associated family protein [Chitinophagaceae bacterium]
MPATTKDATQEVISYIESLPDWSKKILTKLRSVILNADPAIVEDWKWGPNYASNGMVCGFSAFQKHTKLTFFNGSDMRDPNGLFNHCVDNEFNRSIKYVDESEIDEKTLTAYVKESVAVNKKGFKRVVQDKTVETPDDLQKALSANKKAAQFFDDLSYGYKKEFVEHVTTAKQEATRTARIAKIVSYCEDQKTLNHKYK